MGWEDVSVWLDPRWPSQSAAGKNTTLLKCKARAEEASNLLDLFGEQHPLMIEMHIACCILGLRRLYIGCTSWLSGGSLTERLAQGLSGRVRSAYTRTCACLIDSPPTQSSSLWPRRGPTLSSTFVLAISTNEDHRHQRQEDGRMKECVRREVGLSQTINASDEK